MQVAAIEVGRLFSLDLLARRFGDPAVCRLYFATPGTNLLFESTMSQRWSFGSFESNRQALDELVSGAKRAAAMDAINRTALPAEPYSPLVEAMRPLLVQELADSDYVRAVFRGLVTLLAIERYRLNTGVYPSALSELVPSQLASLPLDPWTGKPLCFKLIDPLTDIQHRSFLLYSVGKDGMDNGGLESPTLTRMGLYDARGFDLIINTDSE